jgi:hypothetical protein
MPAPNTERDPARIDVLLQQLERVWKQHPDQRLGQLLVNLLDPEPNRLFYVEDHTVSEKIFELLETGRWPAGRGSPPEWVLSGERPPPEVRERLRPIFDRITRSGEVQHEDALDLLDAVLDREPGQDQEPPNERTSPGDAKSGRQDQE